MKYVLLLALLAVAAAKNDRDKNWNNFKGKFFKKYRGDQEERGRRGIFEARGEKINKHNALKDQGLSSYSLGYNKYSDLTDDEIASRLLGFNGDNNYTSTAVVFVAPKTTTSATVDWRKKGLVTPVKDQGECGACYAFSATGSLEGQIKKKTGVLVTLSEQNLVDCSQSQGNDGCDGGWMNQAFKYIKSNGGLDTEVAYPYAQAHGDCAYDPSGSGVTVTGYVNVPTGDEKSLMKAVASIGPVSAAINAGGDFSSYESGIYDPLVCPNSINDLTHAILIVGYGTENGQDYWLVKNSWGDTWGIQGYIKLARNKNNVCGIATKASYPLV